MVALMRMCVAVVLLFGLSLAHAAAGDRANAPKWIWDRADAANTAPAGKVYFRKSFDLNAEATARIEITCDNVYTLFVNNQKLGSGDNWGQRNAYEFSSLLKKGKNAIAIVAENGAAGPAGLVAQVIVKSEGKSLDLSTGSSWKFSTREADGWKKADFDDRAWEGAKSLGDFGSIPPWGNQVAAAKETRRPAEFDVRPRPAGPFQLLDGDRVVFVGDTLVERAQNTDYIETFLTARYPDRSVIFRNLGWSGDTVFGDARAGFGTAADGFEQLRQQVYTLKPTVIFVAYGGNSSFDGKAGLSRFEQGFQTLLELLETTRAEIVLVSPIRHEDMGRPLPDPRAHNESLELYTQAIAAIAKSHGHRFIDFFHQLRPAAVSVGTETRPGQALKLTENGIHLSAYGYWCAARAIDEGLGLARHSGNVSIDVQSRVANAAGTEVRGIAGDAASLRFELTDARLPEPLSPEHVENGRLVRFTRLPAGKYTLKIDGKPVLAATADEWAKGRLLRSGPEFDQVEKLRETIVAKNRLYFYRWRPQNETYLFGFRKHEQGQNAKEVPMFDPLVSKRESEIAALRVPVKHQYELVRDR